MELEAIENVVGRQWMTWVGVLILFIAGGFLGHWGIQNGYLGPTVRFIIGLAASIGAVVAGEVFYRRSYRAMGRSLIAWHYACLCFNLCVI